MDSIEQYTSKYILHVARRHLTATPSHAIVSAYRLIDLRTPNPSGVHAHAFRLLEKQNREKMVQVGGSESQSGLVQVSQCLDIACGIVTHLVHGNVLRTTTDWAAA
jgi:hypothetical protein